MRSWPVNAIQSSWLIASPALSTRVPGITLYEMRRLSPETGDSKHAGPLGSSGSSLHAKTFSVDRSRFFGGSPHSTTANSYEVRLSNTGPLYWIERRGDELVRHNTELGASWWSRAAVWFLSLIPIGWLLRLSVLRDRLRSGIRSQRRNPQAPSVCK